MVRGSWEWVGEGRRGEGLVRKILKLCIVVRGWGCSPAGVELDAEETLEMGEEELYMVGSKCAGLLFQLQFQSL